MAQSLQRPTWQYPRHPTQSPGIASHPAYLCFQTVSNHVLEKWLQAAPIRIPHGRGMLLSQGPYKAQVLTMTWPKDQEESGVSPIQTKQLQSQGEQSGSPPEEWVLFSRHGARGTGREWGFKNTKAMELTELYITWLGSVEGCQRRGKEI